MTTSPYLTGNFAPVDDELTALDLEVTGALPTELTGRLLRIGPNPVSADREKYHWFTGNGMVHGVRLEDGAARWYRRRFVRDDQVVEAKGWPPVAGPQHGELGGGTA
ncbi:MAG TPA: carotenoid oxygenase family protein, partial [Myxococcota bacterium]|nr:carotenoid oxygenase family protein [Myxococcota bacterium]